MKFLPRHVRLAADQAVQLGRAIQEGRSFNLALVPSEVSRSEDIESYLPGYSPFGGYRADEIAPIRLVDKDVGKYRIYGLSNIFRLIHTETSIQAPVPKVDPETSEAQYSVIQHALGSVIAPATERQAEFPIRAFASRKIADALALRREYNVITAARVLSAWGTAQRKTLTSTNQWWVTGTGVPVGSDPIADLQELQFASTQPITDYYMGLFSAQKFVSHPKVRDYIRAQIGQGAYDQALVAVNGQQATGGVDAGKLDFRIPGLPPIHVAGGRYLNDSDALVEIIGNDVIAVSNPARDMDWESIRTFQTFRSKMGSGTGWVAREFREEAQGLEGVDVMVAGYAEAVVMPSNTAGGFLQAVTG